ncbi:uncharacterized protein, PH0010 family [Thioflavicoccus mobilis 8321]|uniref:Uncharacterized protein, PH0010 family n=1 Tax=Thioflavicoccus mobilis 8321 TaxID=765912 RepID=L0H262_9GAMM|nr:AmmeMemoRadiSam system protein A [Thioflavicoccus mobilis]AGA91740.1 uncharacterized protein, PH0010 family [Thioflavicoccus mobilis 8321]
MSSTSVPGSPGKGEATYDDAERRLLLGVAVGSIAHGLARRVPLVPDPRDYPAALRAVRATFVTLEIGTALRGCIGVLAARRPLVADVAHNAFAAAFEDPRFPPLAPAELHRLTIHVSVLSPPQALRCDSRVDLLAQLRPEIDGLILEDRGQRGTFLPSVWEQLANPADFLAHLCLKAGLAADHWSDSVAVSRYTTESFAAPAAELLDDNVTRMQ